MSFVNFLQTYSDELSLNDNCSVPALCEEVEHNSRLLEPLILYIKITQNKEQQNKINATLVKEELNRLQKINDVEFALRGNSLSQNYQKVYNSYLVEIQKDERIDRSKRLALKRIQALQQERNVPVYKICKDLKLNLSQVQEFLINENINVLSLSDILRILDYLSF